MKYLAMTSLILGLLYCTSFSQSSRKDTEKYISADYNYSLTTNQSARLCYSLTDSDKYYILDLSLCSVASQYDGKKLRISSNSIFSAIGGMGLLMAKSTYSQHSSDVFTAATYIILSPLLLQSFTNPTLKYQVYSHRSMNTAGIGCIYNSELNPEPDILIYLTMSIKTDYYLLNDVARIYSEGKIGLKGRFYNAAAEAQVGIPFTKGYFQNKTPYLGISAFYYIE